MTEPDLANHGYQCFLYALHQEGRNASEAHEKLLRATGTEVITLEQVEEHFERIKAREFTMSVDQNTSEGPHIFQLLAVAPIRDVVMAHCDLSDRLTLRKVSNTFKDIVEDSSFKLKELSIGNHGDKAYIKADNFKVRYAYVRNGYVVSKGARTVYKKSNEGLIFLQKNDLLTIVKLSKLEIGELRVNDGNHDSTDVRWDILNFLKHHDKFVKVRRLRTVELSSLLHFDPEFIEVFELISLNDEAFVVYSNEIFESEQWKNLKELITDKELETFDIVKDFGHLDYVDFKLEQQESKAIVSIEELVALKDKLLTRPTLQKFEIIPTRKHPADDPIFLAPPESFLPFRDPSDTEWYHFKYPGSEERLSVRIAYDGILFKGPCYCGDKIEIYDRRQAVEEQADGALDEMEN